MYAHNQAIYWQEKSRWYAALARETYGGSTARIECQREAARCSWMARVFLGQGLGIQLTEGLRG